MTSNIDSGSTFECRMNEVESSKTPSFENENHPFNDMLAAQKVFADLRGNANDKDNLLKETDKPVDLKFDYTPVGRIMVLTAITLPDGGKVTRVTAPLDGRDGESGARVLKGYSLPSGKLLESEIHRNTDGTITVRDVDNENRKTDRHEQRMTEAEFVQFIKDQS